MTPIVRLALAWLSADLAVPPEWLPQSVGPALIGCLVVFVAAVLVLGVG